MSPTTTTLSPTTTTLAPTTTTTTQACVTSVSFEVDSAGDVRYVDCCGNTIYLTFGIGPQVINDCIQNGSLFGVGATISSISYGLTGCTCVTTTTTLAPTTTTLAPTTTTTTAAPPPPTSTTTTAACATLDWTFTESGGANGTMDLYVNGNIVESRSNTSSGQYNVCVGDTISVEVFCNTCSSPNNYSNAYSLSDKPVLTDAACGNNTSCSITTATYTVVAGDVGTTINLDTFATCDSGCI